MKYLRKFSTLLLMALSTASCLGQSGGVDLSFGVNGKVTESIGGGNSLIRSGLVQSDDKVLAVGDANMGVIREILVIKVFPDGTFDPSFGIGGRVTIAVGSSSTAYSVALQSDGKIIVVGSANISSQFHGLVIRLMPNGDIDPSFRNGGVFLFQVESSFTSCSSVEVTDSDDIVVAGSAGPTGNSDFFVSKLLPAGEFDPSFDSDGIVRTDFAASNDYANSVAIQSDGKIVVGGSAEAGSNADFAVVRYNSDGTLDPTFSLDGKTTTAIGSSQDQGNDLIIQPDGKIVLAGRASVGSGDFGLVRYLPDGNLDLTFGGDGIVTTAIGVISDTPNSVLYQPDGKIVAAGNALVTGIHFAVVRYNSDGSLDTSFDSDGILSASTASSNYLTSIGLLSDGSYFGVGYVFQASSTNSAFLKLNSNGARNLAFDSDGMMVRVIGVGGASANSLAAQPDGKVLSTGVSYDGSSNELVVLRHMPDGLIDSTFSQDGKAILRYGSNTVGNRVHVTSDDKVVVTGWFADIGGNLPLVARYLNNGLLDVTFHSDGVAFPGSSLNMVNSSLLQPDGKIVLIGNKNGTTTDVGLIRFNVNGSLDATFDSDGVAVTDISAVANEAFDGVLLSDGKIVVVGTSLISSLKELSVVRYLPDGSLDNSFDSDGHLSLSILGGSFTPVSIIVEPDNKMVIAGKLLTSGNSDLVIVRLNEDGTFDSTFDSDGITLWSNGTNNDEAKQLIRSSDGKYLVSGISDNGVTSDFRFLRFNIDGSLDLTFDSDGVAEIDISGDKDYSNAIISQAGNKTILAGSSISSNRKKLTLVRYATCATSYSTLSISACNSYTWTDGVTYTSSGMYSDTLVNEAGCDSIATLHLTINNNSSSQTTISTCDSYTWTNGITYTSSGTYTQLLTNAVGCDSIATLDLTIINSTSSVTPATACDSYIWTDGNTYTSSGLYTQILINAVGCDSIASLDLTILSSTSSLTTVTECGSYTWTDGITYTSSGIHTQILTNAAGCDSIVTLDLTINYPTTGTDTQFVCDSYAWIDGNTYTSSNNTATFTLTNAAGCDSIVTLDLTILNSTTGTDVQSACGSYTWIDGNTYNSSNSTATFTLTNAAGCDSIVTLSLTILNSSGTDSQTACGSYTWIDGNTYTSSNNTAAFILTNTVGCDSIVTLDLTILTPSTGMEVQTACGSFTWIDGNTYTASTNTPTFTLSNAIGCDSVVTLNLTVNTPTSGADVQSACGSFIWIDGNTYTSSNSTATFTLTNEAGCDSVVTLNLTINAFPTANATDNGNGTITATGGGTYSWINCTTNATVLGATSATFSPAQNGTYAAIVTNGSGCKDTSNCVVISNIGLTEVDVFDVTIAPNPATDHVTITFKGSVATLVIRDAQGKVLHEQGIGSGEMVNLKEFASGIYFFELGGQQQTVIKRIIRQ